MRDTIKIDSKNCKMIAHRGASGVERENTLPAFVAGGNRSYFGMETDIHPTLDGRFVIIHDSNTSRVSSSDVDVEKCRYQDLKSLRLKDLDGEERGDLCLPLLEEYLRIAKAYDKHCVIELKGVFSRENIEKVVEIVRSVYSLDNATFIAFDIDNLVILRELLPSQKLQYLCFELNDELLATLKKYNLDLDVYYKCLTKEWVDAFHAHGIEVNCWTVDDKQDAEKLIEMGVDFITSNILE